MHLLKWFRGNIKKVVSKKDPFNFIFIHSYKKIIRMISTLVPSFLDFYPVVYKKGDFYLRLAPTLLSYVMYEYDDVRKDDELFIRSLLKEGDIYVDIGANVGNTTLSAAIAVGEKGQVYSFEAHPRTYKYLLRSISCNENLISRIKTKNVALGEKTGEVSFTDLQNDDINKISISGSFKVKMETLDEQGLPQKINLLKIDVEGYEYFVLKGAKNLLHNIDIVVFESFLDNYKTFNVTLLEIINYLRDFNFSLYKIEKKELVKIEDSYTSYECEDLIACKNIKLLLDKGYTLKNIR